MPLTVPSLSSKISSALDAVLGSPANPGQRDAVVEAIASAIISEIQENAVVVGETQVGNGTSPLREGAIL